MGLNKNYIVGILDDSSFIPNVTSAQKSKELKAVKKELSKTKAFNQEEAIMDIFVDRGLMNMTPSDVWHIYCEEIKNIPLTSIRRAITSLTDRKYLIKTDIMRQGIYGKPEHCWRLAKAEDKQLELLQLLSPQQERVVDQRAMLSSVSTLLKLGAEEYKMPRRGYISLMKKNTIA